MACCEPISTDVMAMNHRVTIQSPGGTAGSDGHVDESLDANWTNAGQRWSKITTRGGSEGYRFNQVQAQVTHVVEMRSDSFTRSIVPSWRVKFGSRKFDIVAVYDVDEAKQTVRCDCAEQV